MLVTIEQLYFQLIFDTLIFVLTKLNLSCTLQAYKFHPLMIYEDKLGRWGLAKIKNKTGFDDGKHFIENKSPTISSLFP